MVEWTQSVQDAPPNGFAGLCADLRRIRSTSAMMLVVCNVSQVLRNLA